MAMRYSIPVILLLSLFCVSCHHDYVKGVLYNAERLMEADYPDSALMLLSSLRPEDIHRKGVRARLSLDRAMAMDKCFIDTTEIAVLQPAIEYYRGCFHRREQFLTRYYHARILENGCHYQEALEMFAATETVSGHRPDSLYRMRISAAKARIYVRSLALKQAEDAIDEAIRWAGNHTPDKESLLLDKVEHLLARANYAVADSILSIIQERSRRWLDECARLCMDSPSYFRKYRNSLKQYTDTPPDMLGTLTWAQVQHFFSHNDLALDALESYKPEGDFQTVTYWLVRREVEMALGKTDEALRSALSYTESLESMLLRISKQDTRYVEDRFQMQQSMRKQRRIKALWISLCLVSIFVVAVTMLSFKRKRLDWVKKVEDLRSEYAALVRYRNSVEAHNDRVGRLLDSRIRALAPFLNDGPPGILDRSPELDRLLSDRKNVLCNIGLLFALYHPSFVQELEGYGLDYLEIGYCCLYALGFRIKELPDILGRDAYHINPHIRKKVGLDPHSTNLPIWVHDLYLRCEKERSG